MDSRTKALLIIAGVVVVVFLLIMAWLTFTDAIERRAWSRGTKEERERQEKLQAATLKRWNTEHDAAISDLQQSHAAAIDALKQKMVDDLREINTNVERTYEEYEQRAKGDRDCRIRRLPRRCD